MTATPSAVAERLLLDAGLPARVTAAGHDGSVAKIRLERDLWPRLTESDGRRLAERIRLLGFRYVAIDLDGLTGDGIDDQT